MMANLCVVAPLCLVATLPPARDAASIVHGRPILQSRLYPVLLAASDGGNSEAPPSSSLQASQHMPPTPQERTQSTGSRAYVVLMACVLLYVTNQWARMLPSYLVNFDAALVGAKGHSGHELMNVALGFNAQQYGLLISYGFTLLYVLCSFPAGVACDIYSRKYLLLAAACGWSVATAASACARSFSQLLVSRILLGIAQAFSGPAAHTLISAKFPPHRRATAHSIYTSGIYLGGALASLSVLFSRMLGWRATALMVACASIPPAALLAISLRNDDPASKPAPLKASAAKTGDFSLRAAVQEVLSVGSVRWLLAGAGARLFAGFAIGAFAAPYYRSAFPAKSASYSLINACIVAGGGTLAVVGGGLAADHISQAGARPERAALIPALGALLAIPFWLVAVRSNHFGLAMASLLGAYLLAETWFGATIAMLQAAVTPSICGTAQGLLNVVQVFSSLSPPIIGGLYRRGAPLRLLLSLSVPLAYVATALCFWRAGVNRASEGAALES